MSKKWGNKVSTRPYASKRKTRHRKGASTSVGEPNAMQITWTQATRPKLASAPPSAQGRGTFCTRGSSVWPRGKSTKMAYDYLLQTLPGVPSLVPESDPLEFRNLFLFCFVLNKDSNESDERGPWITLSHIIIWLPLF